MELLIKVLVVAYALAGSYYVYRTMDMIELKLDNEKFQIRRRKLRWALNYWIIATALVAIVGVFTTWN